MRAARNMVAAIHEPTQAPVLLHVLLVIRGLSRWWFDCMNVQALSAAGLCKRNLGVLRCPTARRPRLVRGMHRVGKQHSFIVAERVEQIVISRDEFLLPHGIKFARNHEPRGQALRPRSGARQGALVQERGTGRRALLTTCLKVERRTDICPRETGSSPA